MKTLIEFIKALFVKPPPGIERPSPKIRITEEQARAILEKIKTVPGYEQCFLAGVAPSNSMEPGIDDGMYVVLDPSIPCTDLIEGDIIYYVTPTYEAIHRIIKIGNDTRWFCRCMGDNNAAIIDPVIIRAEHIKGVWRMTLN